VVNDDLQAVVARLVELAVGPGAPSAPRSAGTPPNPRHRSVPMSELASSSFNTAVPRTRPTSVSEADS
jgi:hypothetical protein